MTTVERILDLCDISDCWRWQGQHNKNGYGAISIGRTFPFVHRVIWEELVGPIPEGLEIDHLCKVRDCVNPDHLEPVTHLENVRRSYGIGGWNRNKTHCPRGHEYSEMNTYRNRGWRTCRSCKRRHAKLEREKRTP